MRRPSHVLFPAVVAAFGITSCSHSVSPGRNPSLGSDTGIVVLVVDTDTPLRNLKFTQVEAFYTFKLDFADRGRSVHVFKVPAARYLLSEFDSGNDDLTPDAGGELCVNVIAGQMNYPGHFVYRGSEQKKGYRTYANWKWRLDEEDMKRRVAAEWSELMGTYPVETTACP